MTGQALEFYATLTPEIHKDFDKLTLALCKEFKNLQTERMAALKLRHRRMQPNETVNQYVADLRRLAKRAYPSLDQDGKDHFLCDAFIFGLYPEALVSAVLDRDPDSFRSAVEIANRIDARRKLTEEEARLRAAEAASQARQGEPKPEKLPPQQNLPIFARQFNQESYGSYMLLSVLPVQRISGGLSQGKARQTCGAFTHNGHTTRRSKKHTHSRGKGHISNDSDLILETSTRTPKADLDRRNPNLIHS